MLQNVTQSEIVQRVKAVNLTLRCLGQRAGLSITTAYRGPRTLKNHHALLQELVAEEIRLRDHLLALHPLEEKERTAA